MINYPRKQTGVAWKSQQMKEALSKALGKRKWSPAYQGWGRVGLEVGQVAQSFHYREGKVLEI